MKTCFRIFSAAILITAFAVSQANAALLPSYYTDRAAWQADVVVNSNVTFVGLAPNGQDFYPTPLDVNGVTFSSTDAGGALYVQDDSFENIPGSYQGLNSGEVLQAYTDVTITNPTPFSAFGVDLRGYFDPNDISGPQLNSTFDIELSNGDMFTISVANPQSPTDPIPFFGFASLQEFSWVKISAGQDFYIVLDNVSFASTTIPEPTSIAVFGIGGLLARFGIARRKNRKA